MTLIDLSAAIRPGPPDHAEPFPTEIQFDDHAQGAATIGTFIGVAAELLLDGKGWATGTFLRFGTHNSTHVDAPWHYTSTVAGRRAARHERHFAGDGEHGLAYRVVVEYVPRGGLRGLFDRVIFRRAVERAVRSTVANLDARFATRDASS